MNKSDIFKNLYNTVTQESIQSKVEEEYQAIKSAIELGENVFVSSLAGSGKSTTTHKLCKAMPHLNKVYITFNKANADEAKEKFSDVSNIDIRTTYSFANVHIRKTVNLQGRVRNTIFKNDYAKMLGITPSSRAEYEFLEDIIEIYETWLCSDKTLEEYCSTYGYKVQKKYLDKIAKEMFSTGSISHAGYLKQLQLQGLKLRNVDIIFVDEIQDAPQCLVSLLLQTGCQLVVVGDFFQAINGFMSKISCKHLLDENFEKYSLSTCFRMGDTNARVINALMRNMTGEKFGMIGANNNQHVVEVLDPKEKRVILCRTNYEIIEKSAEAVRRGKSINFHGIDAEMNVAYDKIKNAYEFKYAYKKHPEFSRFKNFDDMRKLVQLDDDLADIRALVKIVDNFQEDTIEILDEIRASIVDYEDADWAIMTAHRSKGMTITDRAVELGEGMLNPMKEGRWEMGELCLLYVALSRSVYRLKLPQNIIQFIC